MPFSEWIDGLCVMVTFLVRHRVLDVAPSSIEWLVAKDFLGITGAALGISLLLYGLGGEIIERLQATGDYHGEADF